MMTSITAMQGTEKQIVWAIKIRDQKISAIKKMLEGNKDIAATISESIKYLEAKSSAKWWIDNRENGAGAFLGYCDYKVTGKLSVDYFSIQTWTGEQKEEKTVLCSVGIIDLSKAKNPTKIINSIEIKTIYYSNGELSYQLSSKPFEDKEDEKSSIQPLKDFLPTSISLNDTEIIAVKTFGSEDRLAGENITAFLFKKETP